MLNTFKIIIEVDAKSILEIEFNNLLINIYININIYILKFYTIIYHEMGSIIII